MKTTRVVGCVLLAVSAGHAGAQPLDRFTQVGTPLPNVCPLVVPYGITPAADGGCAIVGGALGSCEGINLVKVKYNGNISWEMHYGDAPYYYSGSGRSVQQTADGGYVIAAFPQLPPDGGSPYHLGILKVDSNGKVQWGRLTKADGQDSPVAYKLWDAERVRELPDGSFVAISNKRYTGDDCSETGTADDGVLFRVKADGTPVYSRVFGQAGFGSRSHVAFTDLAVSDLGIFVIGTIRGAGYCDACDQDIDGLLAWFTIDGTFVAAWELDGVVDPPPNSQCPHPTSPEWGCGLALQGSTAYFSLTDWEASGYNGPSNAFVGAFDLGAGGLIWSERVKSLFPMYHCVELSSRGYLLVGGHWTPMEGSPAAITALDPSTGALLWSQQYIDPRSPSANALQNLRGFAPTGRENDWVVNGGYWGGGPGTYFMSIDPLGHSECSWRPRDTGLTEGVQARRVDLEPVEDLDIKEWYPEYRDVSTISVDPCR